VKMLKQQNAKILRAYVGFVIAALAVYSTTKSGVSFSELLSGNLDSVPFDNLAGFTLASFVYLLIARLLPTSVKEALVFWRWQERLPANRAFTTIAKRDERVKVSALRDKHGPFPEQGDTQNSLWYSIYRRHQNEPGVLDANKHYLLYRDLSAANFLLTVLVLPLLYIFGSLTFLAVIFALIVLMVVGVFFSLNARSSGTRLVENVLAVESAELS